MLDVYLTATYADGFVLTQTADDRSPYDEGCNFLHAILHSRACPEHGPLEKLALVTPENTYTVDWTVLPDNARPIYYRRFDRREVNGHWIDDPLVVALGFGYQYTLNGKNEQEVIELT